MSDSIFEDFKKNAGQGSADTVIKKKEYSTEKVPEKPASGGTAQITDFWVDGVIIGMISYHMLIVSEKKMPANFQLMCQVEDIAIGMFGKETPIIQFNGYHPLKIVTTVDGRNMQKVRQLEDGRYETECALVFSTKELICQGKRGKHSLTVMLSGIPLKDAFLFNQEYKV